MEVSTKDCAALDDVELVDMADMTASTVAWEVGRLGKESDDWVLVSQARQRGVLKGFIFTTLERIGGTPALVIGPAATAAGKSSSSAIKALMTEQFHRALMAFPDEDVLVALRAMQPGALETVAKLADVRPADGARANGEERAWGRRLSKRYGAISFDDRSMVARGDGDDLFVHHQPSSAFVDDVAVFDGCDVDAGDYLIAWGWARVEYLEKFARA